MGFKQDFLWWVQRISSDFKGFYGDAMVMFNVFSGDTMGFIYIYMDFPSLKGPPW